MKFVIGVIALGIVAMAGCRCTGVPEELKISFARDAFAPLVEKGELPGVISVFCDGDRQETSCVGFADMEAKRPITLDDPFQQCSQTKGFCGVTIAMLVEEGRISLDDPVSKYLPAFKEMWVRVSETNGVRKLVKAKNAITVRMCLNHTSGLDFELPKYEQMGGWSHRMPLKSVAVMASALPLLFEPGTSAKYSNVGIDVGAAVVEAVTGMRWEDFLRKRVFEPLEMRDSTFNPTDEQLARAIGIYEVHRGKPAKRLAECPAMQLVGECYYLRDVNNAAAERFFKVKIDGSGADAYTGRMN